MKIMNKEEIELFKNILSSTQPVLKRAMQDYLVEVYGQDRVIVTKEYIVALGDTPIGLVAHMDTVHRTPVAQLFYDKEQNVMWSPQGIGADDRAGVYSIIELTTRGLMPTIILTTDEEVGGLGAIALVSDISTPPVPINFLIELDRQGRNDSVYYDCDNRLFEKYINHYGFVSDWGSFSDISYIAPAWGIAAVNLSVGYFNEHSVKEYLNVGYMYETIDKVENILNNVCKDDAFEYVEAEKGVASWLDYGVIGMSNDGICWHCLESYDESMLVPFHGETYCGDCYAEHFSTCTTCSEAFHNPNRTYIECDKCRNN